MRRYRRSPSRRSPVAPTWQRRAASPISEGPSRPLPAATALRARRRYSVASAARSSRTTVGADPAVEDKDEPGSALKSLRDRLIQRQQR